MTTIDFDNFTRDSLMKSIQRLKRLADVNAPDFILAREICILYDRAQVALRKEMGEAVITRAVEKYRRINGFCEAAGCNEVLTARAPFCPTHTTLEETSEDDEALDEEEP